MIAKTLIPWNVARSLVLSHFIDAQTKSVGKSDHFTKHFEIFHIFSVQNKLFLLLPVVIIGCGDWLIGIGDDGFFYLFFLLGALLLNRFTHMSTIENLK